MNLKASKLKALGLYIVFLLALARFVIVPLHSALITKKTVLAEKAEVYRTRQALLQRQDREVKKTMPSADSENTAELLYPQAMPLSAVQAEAAADLIERAGAKGLTVINFELSETVPGESLTEAGVIFRFSGRQAAVIEFLEGLEKSKKRLNIKSFETYKSGEEQFVTAAIAAYRVGR